MGEFVPQYPWDVHPMYVVYLPASLAFCDNIPARGVGDLVAEWAQHIELYNGYMLV